MQDKLPIAVILAAGMGSRLGRPHPKPLTRLDNGESIMTRQLRILRQHELQVIIVVGFKLEMILEAHPDAMFCYNPNFDTTNTSKSLLCALRQTQARDVLWLNGDVVFESQVIERLLQQPDSSVAVNNARVAEEEVKYTLNKDGYINAISKQVKNALGESLGVNLIRNKHLADFIKHLADVGEQEYFEKAMESLIQQHGAIFKPVDVSDLACIEVDFSQDLEQANKLFS